MSMAGLLGGGAGAGDPGAPTINAVKRQRRPPWEEVLESPEAPTINDRKHRQRAPWEVVSENSGAPIINARKCR
jgi:hypothetical protein